MLVAFSVAPSGGGTDSVGDVVAEAVRVVRESGLPNETTSMFTTIEAPTWDEAMEVVKRAVEAVAALDDLLDTVLDLYEQFAKPKLRQCVAQRAGAGAGT